jgi:hypothetical protein
MLAKSRKRLTMLSAMHILSAKHKSLGRSALNRQCDAVRAELKFARHRWNGLKGAHLATLRILLNRYKLSIALGEITDIDNNWYVTHSGLLQLAVRHRCYGIETYLEERVSNPAANRWVFKAVVYKSSGAKGFVGYGDADPFNVSTLARGAEMRIAETRAVNRALRKAYGIGICSVEELGCSRITNKAPAPERHNRPNPCEHGSNNGEPRLRDRLCILIRQHGLDPTLVKAYAADFCGTATLSGASRELVESFISHLSAAAKENRDGLVCKLNSYAQPTQVNQ